MSFKSVEQMNLGQSGAREAFQHRPLWSLLLLCSAMVILPGCKQEASQSDSSTYTAPVPGAITGDGETGGANGQGPSNPNQTGAPFVNAGRDQSADPNVILMLQGEVTTATGEDPASLSWTQVEGPSVVLLTSNQIATSFLAPDVETTTLLRFRLSAQDVQGRLNSDSVAVTVNPLESFIRVIGGSVTEAATEASFTIKLNQASLVPITVTYTTQDVTATAGSDYVATSGSLAIAPGETTATVTVQLLPDSSHEINEHFLLKIVGVVNGDTAASTGAFVIQDDDPATTVPNPAPQTVTAQGSLGTYPTQRRTAHVVAVPNGYSSFRNDDLVLQLNGEQATVDPATGIFQFVTPVEVGSTYTAGVARQPGNLSCAVNNATGTVSSTAWALDVQCTPPTNYLSNPRKISAGEGFTCLLDDHGVTCWGDNESGQTSVPSLRSPSVISAGWNHACAIDLDGVKCWGDNSNNKATPPSTLQNPVEIASGESHTCAIHDLGVACWGGNGVGQLNVPTTLVNPTGITAGQQHTCVLDSGSVVCWGQDQDGQISATPTFVNPIEVSAGARHNCAIDETGSGKVVSCWGHDSFGQASVSAVAPLLTNPVSVSGGEEHSCAINQGATTNQVICWGATNDPEVSSVPSLTNPTELSAGRRPFSLGPDHTCALDDNGVQCWGNNIQGQSTAPNIVNPTDVVAGDNHACAMGTNGVACWGISTDPQSTAPTLSSPTLLAAGSTHNCALDSGGLQCWGTDGGTGKVSSAPTLSGITDLALGGDHSCALAGGSVNCWGDSAFGQALPTTLTQPTAISAGFQHSCAIDSTGVTCTGSDNYGETSQTPSFTAPTAIASGTHHNCALDSTGVQCWGYGFGSAPLFTIPSLQNPTGIFAGAYASCAIDGSGAKCWGDLPSGASTLMTTLENPRSIAIGDLHVCALDDRAIKCLYVIAL